MKKKKPIIGVMALWDDEKESMWMLPGYLEGIEAAGGIPIVLPFSEEEEDVERLAKICDGFLFTGGHDVSTKLYDETPLAAMGGVCEKRDTLEQMYLEEAICLQKPVLGICRGIQIINVLLGGSLYQDLPTQHPSPIEHHQTPPYDVPVHEVELFKDSPLYELIKKEHIPVNSYHHQAVKDLAFELEPMAVSPDGLVEAVYMPTHPFLWGLQWHPEFIWKKDENCKRIFRAFVEAAM